MKSLNDIAEYLEQLYWDNDQQLNFKGLIDAEAELAGNRHTFQEVYVGDLNLFEIRTLSEVFPSEEVFPIPYCIRNQEWGGFVFTVQECRQLTPADIDKAIWYLLRQILPTTLIFNVNYEDRKTISQMPKYLYPERLRIIERKLNADYISDNQHKES